MKMRTIQQELPAADRPLTRLLWLLFWATLWVVGFTVAAVTIENLYFR